VVRLNRRFCRALSPFSRIAHQPGDASAADGKPIVATFVPHARAATRAGSCDSHTQGGGEASTT
jgi:hypothetical protein